MAGLLDSRQTSVGGALPVAPSEGIQQLCVPGTERSIRAADAHVNRAVEARNNSLTDHPSMHMTLQENLTDRDDEILPDINQDSNAAVSHENLSNGGAS